MGVNYNAREFELKSKYWPNNKITMFGGILRESWKITMQRSKSVKGNGRRWMSQREIEILFYVMYETVIKYIVHYIRTPETRCIASVSVEVFIRIRTHMKSDRLCASIYVPRDGECLCAYKPVSLFVYVNRYIIQSMCTYGKYADRSYSVDRGYFVG